MAARAGVSRATASRVLNDHPRVAEATRRAVEQAVAELGYAPNRAARSLAGQRHDTVALVVSEPSTRVFTDPFFAATIRGAAAALGESRYQLVLLMTQGDADRTRVERYLLRGNADGVLLLSAHATDPLPARLAEAGIPCMLAGRPPHIALPPPADPPHRAVRPAPASAPATAPAPVAAARAAAAPAGQEPVEGPPGEPAPVAVPAGARIVPPTGLGIGYVDADNVGGAGQAVAHLVGRGRVTVATVAGPVDMAPGVDRRRGWELALCDAGREPDAALVAAADFTRPGGAAATAELLRRRPDLDAVFAASDLMALGVLDALRQAGRRVPDDVAVVGFDDGELARMADPPLTTVRQPLEQLGRTMADQLVAWLDGHTGPTGLILPTELVVRASS